MRGCYLLGVSLVCFSHNILMMDGIIAYRNVKSLSLEGCSLLTIGGFDSVVHSWKDLQTLKVVSCNGIKDSEITPELATLFSVLKELKWRPDSRSLLASSLSGTGVGKKGTRFFKRI